MLSAVQVGGYGMCREQCRVRGGGIWISLLQA